MVKKIYKGSYRNGGDIEVTVKKGWYLGFLGNYPVEKSRDAQIFWKCPHWYTEDDGTMSKSYMDFLLKHGLKKKPPAKTVVYNHRFSKIFTALAI